MKMKRLWEYRQYYLRLPLDWPKDRYRDCVAFWQRGRRGWANRDTWNMDVHLAEIIGPMLRHLAETDMGCPPGFGNDESNDEELPPGNHEAWKAYLREIASGFDEYLETHEGEHQYLVAAYQPALEKMRKLFDYYHALWS